jgi:hypothetical protein
LKTKKIAGLGTLKGQNFRIYLSKQPCRHPVGNALKTINFSFLKNQTMRQIKINIPFLILVSVLFLISCNQPTTISEKNEKDTTQVAATSDTASMPEYDPAMDAYIMGGKGIKKLGDTLGIKMYEVAGKPGESFPLHSHPDHTAYVLQGGRVALFIKALGRQDTIDFPTGMALISGPLSDSGKNIGNTTIKFLVTDIYRPRSK